MLLILREPRIGDIKVYLNQISEFAIYLSARSHSIQEILDHLVRVVLIPLEVNSIVLGELNDDSQIVARARSGISTKDMLSLSDTCNLDRTYPSTDSFRHGKFVWINTLPDWGVEYPLLKKLPEDFQGKTYITFPIYVAGTPVSTMGIFSRKVLVQNAEIQSFLTAVGGIFSLYFYRFELEAPVEVNSNKGGFENNPKLESGALTERQQVILRLISQGKTNRNIAEQLGYSESTVRQETMKIFAKLGCSHRSEAAEIYRKLNQN